MPYTSITKPPIGEPTKKSIIDALIDNDEFFNGNISVSSRVNMIPNGSFEEITGTLPLKWTVTNYSGGSSAINSSNSADGQYSMSFTSTSTANGGGYADTEDYIPVIASESYYVSAFIGASVSGVSSQVDVRWYDSSKTLISTTTAISYTDTPTALTLNETQITAPATAKFAIIRITGGVPGVGTAVGTIYFDSVVVLRAKSRAAIAYAQVGDELMAAADSEAYTSNQTATKFKEIKIFRSGTYRIKFDMRTDVGLSNVRGQIYVNDIATGTIQTYNNTAYSTFSEDLTLSAGDLVSLYAWDAGGSTNNVYIRNFRIYELEPIGAGLTILDLSGSVT